MEQIDSEERVIFYTRYDELMTTYIDIIKQFTYTSGFAEAISFLFKNQDNKSLNQKIPSNF